MSKFREYLIQSRNETYLIDDQGKESKTKEEYIINAEIGLIAAFRLNFSAKSKIKLTKVISGKILENDTVDEILIVETKNKLKYAVPYHNVVWVKTGERWPKGVYDEMKRGSVVVDENDGITQFGELEDGEVTE